MLKSSSSTIEAQARLSTAEKFMALGDMAATLAHEIRNPLVSIGGFASRLKKQLGRDSAGLPYLDQMVKEIGRIEKIMNGVVRFLKDNAVDLQPGDLNDILDEALKLYDEEMPGHNIAVIRQYHDGPLPVMADREQLKIAFDNLIANAIQSMEKGGTIRIATNINGETVSAEVADSGGWIDPRYISHIFNPFFTTKKNGTGLGLPIMNSIVTRHKGLVELSNNPGVGAAFKVKLPAAGGSSIV